MADSEPIEYLEIYKLHAEFADRVSQRREGANRLYVSLLVGLMVFFAAMLKFGIGDAVERPVLSVVGVFGALLSVSWLVAIRSYRQLNSEKFRCCANWNSSWSISFLRRNGIHCRRVGRATATGN